MKKYAKTIPKPTQTDAKNILKEKISKAIDEQQQQQLSSLMNSAFDGSDDILTSVDDIKENEREDSNSTLRRMNSQIPIPTKDKKKKKKRDGNQQKKKSKKHSNSNKYSEIEKERIQYKGMDDSNTTLPFSSEKTLAYASSTSYHLSSSNDPSAMSVEDSLTNATGSNSTKKKDLVLPPISPAQLQLWNLEQEHRKAMDKVEHIKKELNL